MKKLTIAQHEMLKRVNQAGEFSKLPSTESIYQTSEFTHLCNEGYVITKPSEPEVSEEKDGKKSITKEFKPLTFVISKEGRDFLKNPQLEEAN